ncbi:MAG: nucleoside-triphosphatase [Anaerolineae bacterium]|jgi:nucleoside-triphosphatase THEP1
MVQVIILTGDRGVGKTTVCSETISLAEAKGYVCGGILTLTRKGVRDVLDVRCGEARRLTRGEEADQAVTQGRFRFDPKTLSWGNAVLAGAVPCDLLVIDEIGPLEVERGGGWATAFDLLRAGNFALALVVVRPELVVRTQMRLPSSATVVLTVTQESRDRLPANLVRILAREV